MKKLYRISGFVLVCFMGFHLLFSKQKNELMASVQRQVWSGFCLFLFLLIYMGAVLAGGYILRLDTNYYVGADVLSSFPVNLFFIPYYGLAIVSLFICIAAVYIQLIPKNIFRFSVPMQAKLVVVTGVLIAVAVWYVLTNGFNGLPLPAVYTFFNSYTYLF